MSSFVIAKSDYIRAAAFLAAAAGHQDYYGDPVLSLWNARAGRRYTAEDIQRDFTRLYEINAADVAEQYRNATRCTDPESYSEEFAATKAAAAQLLNRGYTLERDTERKQLQRVTYGLIEFLNSARYQIEGEENTRRALRIMNKYYRGLYALLQKLDNVSHDDTQAYWGSFSLSE